MFREWMLPGQTPYSAEELRQLYGLVAEAVEAGEAWSEDELEQAARVAEKGA